MSISVVYKHVVQDATTFIAFTEVDCFFILSGYVLAYQITSQKMSYKNFVISRVARIFPLFLLTFFIALAVHQINPFSSEVIFSFLVEITLLHQLGFSRSLGYNPVSWTISVDFWLNILLLFFICNKYMLLNKKEGFMVLILSSVIFGTIALLQVCPSCGLQVSLFKISFVNSGLLRCAIGLLIGFLIYSLVNSGILNKYNKNNYKMTIFEILALCILFISLYREHTLGYQVVSIISFCFIIVLNKNGGGGISKLSSLPIINQLGNISYGIYLIHYPLILFFSNYADFYKEMSYKPLFLCSLSIIISIPLYYLFEIRMKTKTKDYLNKILSKND